MALTLDEFLPEVPEFRPDKYLVAAPPKASIIDRESVGVEKQDDGSDNTNVRSASSSTRSSARISEQDSAGARNTAKEDVMLEYVESFRRQFVQLFVGRPELLLNPMNEFGLRKFVCCSIRPTLLPYDDLYTMKGCAKFVADFLEFRPFKDVTSLPDLLPSPFQVARMRTADPLDSSNFLVCLLRAAGYDAYVASGFAPIRVTTADLSRTDCPFLEETSYDWADGIPLKDTTDKGLSAAAKVYFTTAAPPRESRYQRSLRERADAERAAEQVAKAAAIRAEKLKLDDPLEGRRVHCWVVVLKGKRDIKHTCYVESTTGHIFKRIGDSPYTRVESVWNERNYWVNVQPQIPPQMLKYNLSNQELWEYVVIEHKHLKRRRKFGFGPGGSSQPSFDTDETSSEYYSSSANTSAQNTARGSGGSGVGDKSGETELSASMAGDNIHVATEGSSKESNSNSVSATSMPSGASGGSVDKENSVANSDNLSAAASNTESGEKTTGEAGSTSGRDGDQATGDDGANKNGGSEANSAATKEREPESELEGEILTLPRSWCPPLRIDFEDFQMRFPNGFKTYHYERCVAQRYAPYFPKVEGHRLKLVAYDDDERTIVTEVREVFEHRKDKLQMRLTFPTQRKFCELFERGRSDGLQCFVEIEGKSRLMQFHSGARVDGMVTRREEFGLSVVEEFENRDDRVVRRTVSVETDTAVASQSTWKGLFTPLGGAADSRELPVKKVTEVYSRDVPVDDADEDVRQSIFHLAAQCIRVDFHFQENRVASSHRIFPKDGGEVEGWQVDTTKPRPTQNFLRKQFYNLLAREKDVIASVRDRERDATELVANLCNERKNVELVEDISEIARRKAKLTEGDEDCSESLEQNAKANLKATGDYLLPFLPTTYKPGKPLTREQANAAKEACLASLKERLLERANIIQNRLTEQSDNLEKRRSTFQRSQASQAEKEQQKKEFQQFYDETMFKIDILEARLSRHEKIALQKYGELNQKLRSDSRLIELFQA